ncbi:MAG: FAD-dependent oxidoreductase [Wenzhouxiangella sp.]|nr:FAD-dependent oxidoreductase [Wenzhouxiangella sp.]TVR93429.1 MAG: FAD-dependent oxidoreductase [Wenzhouxiangellaceae bacterium]
MTNSIAVIGSGISGLSAAHACRKAGWKVTLFEKESTLGMAAHGLKVDGGIVDVPLRVMGEHAWQHVLALATEVGMETFPVNVYVSCSGLDGNTWFRSGRFPITQWPTVGSLRFLGPRALRLGLGLSGLARLTRWLRQQNGAVSLADALKEKPIDPLCWRGLILPLLKTICTCEEEHLLAWPAHQILGLLHGILHQSDLLRLRGGTAKLAAALADGIQAFPGSPIKRLRSNRKSISVENSRGEGGRFDRVIVAVQANQLDFLGDGPYAEERHTLAAIPYANGELIVHRDQRFMPARRQDWTALNFQADEALARSMFTVWVNTVEPSLADKAPVFQTWNPLYSPDPDLVLARIPMQRAVVTKHTAALLEQIRRWHAEPDRRLFYCGSWAFPGVPLLESGVESARSVVGSIKRQYQRGPDATSHG